MGTPPEWAIVTTQVVVGLGLIWATFKKAFPSLVQLLRDRRERKNKEQVLENSRILRESRLLMETWRAEKGAQRVLLLHARDSGKPWLPTDKIKVSCLDQTVNEGEAYTAQNWQDWEADGPYRSLLSDVILSEKNARGVLLITSEMPTSILKNIYLGQGTIASIVFPIHWINSENALIYVSINFGHFLENGEKMDPELKKSYELQARRIFNSPDKVWQMMTMGKQIWKNVN